MKLSFLAQELAACAAADVFAIFEALVRDCPDMLLLQVGMEKMLAAKSAAGSEASRLRMERDVARCQVRLLEVRVAFLSTLHGIVQPARILPVSSSILHAVLECCRYMHIPCFSSFGNVVW